MSQRMVRIQLHLTESQARSLRRLAEARGSTRAALIREGIDRLLGQEEPDDAKGLLGLIAQAGHGGDPNASEDHDRLLAESEIGSPA